MPLYKYSGVHRHTGSRANGSIESGSKADAVRSLSAQGITATSVEEVSRSPVWEMGSGLTARWRIDFFRRLATFVEARLPVPDALALMAKEGQGTSRQRETVIRLAAITAGGSSLTAALRELGSFPANAVALVEAGEASGNLERLLPGAADMLENSYRARQRLLTMMIYPALMLMALVGAMALLILFVLPAFSHLFDQLGTELPPLTRLLLSAGNLLADYGWLFIAGSFLLVAVLFAAGRNPRSRCQLDRLLLRMPLVGSLLALSDSADTAAALSALTGGGLPLSDSLEIAAGVPANTYLSWQLRRGASAVRAGRPLAASLGSDSGFSQIFLSLVAVGEETGTLPESLERAAEICRYESRSRRKKLEAAAEPTMLLVIGGLVAFLVLALALPLLDTVTAL